MRDRDPSGGPFRRTGGIRRRGIVSLGNSGIFCRPATGLVTLLADERFNVPHVAMTVALIVIMVPGIYAFQMVVSLNHGQMLDALQASATFWFVVVALAVGLATALFFSPRQPA